MVTDWTSLQQKHNHQLHRRVHSGYRRHIPVHSLLIFRISAAELLVFIQIFPPPPLSHPYPYRHLHPCFCVGSKHRLQSLLVCWPLFGWWGWCGGYSKLCAKLKPKRYSKYLWNKTASTDEKYSWRVFGLTYEISTGKCYEAARGLTSDYDNVSRNL